VCTISFQNTAYFGLHKKVKSDKVLRCTVHISISIIFSFLCSVEYIQRISGWNFTDLKYTLLLICNLFLDFKTFKMYFLMFKIKGSSELTSRIDALVEIWWCWRGVFVLFPILQVCWACLEGLKAIIHVTSEPVIIKWQCHTGELNTKDSSKSATSIIVSDFFLNRRFYPPAFTFNLNAYNFFFKLFIRPYKRNTMIKPKPPLKWPNR
jgi:hypothetical protein